MRWQPCKRHDGKHQDVHGRCVHWGAPAALRPGHCPEAGCGAEIMRRLDLSNGRVTTVEAGSDLPHTHTAPIRVELDPETLASALLSGFRAARQERQQVQATGPVLVSQPDQPTPRESSGTIWGVPVVKPDDGSA